jgi:AraC family transcriptional regulator, regulatory protein of adaptative response / methylated-DNA-[protein]-cysteine methyltransferase
MMKPLGDMDLLVENSTHDSETYERIARAIAFMRQNHLNQPDLATIAQQVHLSEYHFQRLFTRWAGISPKRFLQYLTVEYAKSKIAETANLLDLTVDSGLSSPGRLHDLFVKLEAMSPGEFKAGGKGLQIGYGIHSTPFGDCLIATTSRGICNLHFLDTTSKEAAEHTLRSEWFNADITQDQQATKEICDRVFEPVTADSKPLVLCVKGTNFQIQVWRALLRVPFGGITTYQGLAEAMGRPTAARAVGNALGRNPVGYLIPCHRVIRESGELGGFRWGLDRKTVLMGWEASQNQAIGQELT